MKRSYSQITTPANSEELFAYTPVVKRTRRVKSKRNKVLFNPKTTLSAFPERRRSKLRYTESLVLDPSAGGTASNVFRTVGAYDPNQSFGGHQPYGFDQWMAVYKNYYVLSSKITIQACAAATGTTKSWRFGITPIDRTTSLPALADDLMEITGSVYSLLETGNGPRTLSLKQNTARTFAVKDVVDNDQLGGTVSSNPAEQTYWIVWVGNGNNGVTDPEPVNVVVTVDYEVMFTEQNVVTNS